MKCKQSHKTTQFQWEVLQTTTVEVNTIKLAGFICPALKEKAVHGVQVTGSVTEHIVWAHG
jgi:hypothetical protein